MLAGCPLISYTQKVFGEPLQHLENTDSTNRVALEWPDAPHGAAVTASQQTAGRGRLGRQWVSPPGTGLYLSVILRPPENVDLAKIALVAAVATAEAVRLTCGAKAVCKWPNDILLPSNSGEYRKIGGILCESRLDRSGIRVVVGIGLNVNQDTAALPARPQFPASSLAILTGRIWALEQVRQAVLQSLEVKCGTYFSGGWSSIIAELNSICAGLGTLVQVQIPGETFLGIAQQVDLDGFLVVRTADGPRRVIAGDVTYL